MTLQPMKDKILSNLSMTSEKNLEYKMFPKWFLIQEIYGKRNH